jgi:hypothetical protein
LYTKLSSCLWAHKSGRAGSTDRSAGLLVGRARLSGTAETLVGGDPWVRMSHTFSSLHPNAGARLRSEILLLLPHLQNPNDSSLGDAHLLDKDLTNFVLLTPH